LDNIMRAATNHACTHERLPTPYAAELLKLLQTALGDYEQKFGRIDSR
jgi:hypothetical protein